MWSAADPDRRAAYARSGATGTSVRPFPSSGATAGASIEATTSAAVAGGFFARVPPRVARLRPPPAFFLSFGGALPGSFVTNQMGNGMACSAVKNERWGLLTEVTLPGGGKLGVYQPLHERPASRS